MRLRRGDLRGAAIDSDSRQQPARGAGEIDHQHSEQLAGEISGGAFHFLRRSLGCRTGMLAAAEWLVVEETEAAVSVDRW